MIMSSEKISKYKNQFTEHQIVSVMQSGKAEYIVKDVHCGTAIPEASYYIWKPNMGDLS